MAFRFGILIIPKKLIKVPMFNGLIKYIFLTIFTVFLTSQKLKS